MTSKQVLLILGCAALLGWYAPDLSGAGKARDENRLAVIEPERASRPQAATHGWNLGQAVLQRESDGHFYANVMIEGGQYRFLVDTGASVVALTGADAEAMGLYWDENSMQRIGRGASGPVYGVPVKIPRMEVGGYEARDVDAAIIPEGLGISLLGQSFLSQISDVSISGDEMRLGG